MKDGLAIHTGVERQSEDRLREACGVYALSASRSKPITHVTTALASLQHRGEDGSGIAFYDKVRCCTVRYRSMGTVDKFVDEHGESVLSKCTTAAIGHVRYATHGARSLIFVQPHMSGKSDVAIAFNGQVRASGTISDAENLMQRFDKFICKQLSDMGAAVRELTEAERDEAYAAVVLQGNRIYAFRDQSGTRPLFVYERVKANHKEVAVSSETCAFGTLHEGRVTEVEPGSLLIIENGQVVDCISTCSKACLCAFEGMYFSREDSMYKTDSFYDLRKAFGRRLAMTKGMTSKQADAVIGVPQSGLAAALGFSAQSGIPLEFGLLKSRYGGRSFIKSDEKKRKDCVNAKLHVQKSAVRDMRVVVVDDTLVRGHTMRRIVALLRENGVSEVHVCIAAPPVYNACTKGIDTGRGDILPAALNSIDEICSQIGADSLSFLTLDDIIGVMGNDICTACFTPVSK